MILTMSVHQGLPVEVTIVGLFILLHYLRLTAAIGSLELGQLQMFIFVHQAENAKKVKETVIVTMIVREGSRVDIEIVVNFIQTLPVIWIAATRSKVLVLTLTIRFARHLENVQKAKETVTVTTIVPSDSPVEITIAEPFIQTLRVVVIAAMISQVLGHQMTIVIAHQAENAQWVRGIVIVTMTVQPDLPVDMITVNSFIPMLREIVIVATISQESVPVMMRVIVRHPEDAGRDKETVTVTVIVLLVLPAGQTIVGDFIPMLWEIMIVVYVLFPLLGAGFQVW